MALSLPTVTTALVLGSTNGAVRLPRYLLGVVRGAERLATQPASPPWIPSAHHSLRSPRNSDSAQQYYTYDDLNRLTGVCYDPTCAGTLTPAICLECVGSQMSLPSADLTPNASDLETSWTYDPVGNRLSEITHLGTTSYAYDAADRLTSVTPPGSGAITHTHDANGNLTAAGADTFAWDYADRLVSATVDAASETTTYAGDGIRLSTDRGAGDETHFTVDRNLALPQLAYETDLGGSLLRRYGYGLGPLSQSSPTDGTFYLHADGLGSISAVTDPAGDPLAWSAYQPFGALRASGADIALPSLAFTGQYLDAATGLYHLRARQYDPATGRFLSIDPVAPSLTDPYVGSYVYVRNTPTLAVDPSGECLQQLAAVMAGPPGVVVGGGSFLVCVAAVALGTAAASGTAAYVVQNPPAIDINIDLAQRDKKKLAGLSAVARIFGDVFTPPRAAGRSLSGLAVRGAWRGRRG